MQMQINYSSKKVGASYYLIQPMNFPLQKDYAEEEKGEGKKVVWINDWTPINFNIVELATSNNNINKLVQTHQDNLTPILMGSLKLDVFWKEF